MAFDIQSLFDPNFAAQMAQNVDPSFLLNFLNGQGGGQGPQTNAGPLAQQGMTTMGSSTQPFDPMAAAGPYAAMLNPTPQSAPPFAQGMGPQSNPLDVAAAGTAMNPMGSGQPAGAGGALPAQALAQLTAGLPKPASPYFTPPVSPGSAAGRGSSAQFSPYGVPQVAAPMQRPTLAQLIFGR